MAMQGRDSLLRKLAKLQGAPRQALRSALGKQAQKIVDQQQRLAPIGRTGKLKNSIAFNYGSYAEGGVNVVGDPDLTVVIHAGSHEVYYARMVEFGTAAHIAGGHFAGSTIPSIRAQPFFFPGYRAQRKSVKTQLTKAIKLAVQQAVAGGNTSPIGGDD